MKKMLLCMAVVVLLASPAAFSGQKRYTMASIPKLRSVWFNRFEVGLINAGKKFDVEVYQQAPAGADEAQQVRLIEDAISQGVDALILVPNDGNSVVPAIRRAKERGMVVLTNESINQEGADWNVEMFDNETYGAAAMDELAKLMGEEGEYVVFVGSLTHPGHNLRADGGIARQKEAYPKMKMVGDRFPVAEDRNVARQATLEILQTYPNLKGMFIFGSQGGPGAGQALREKDLRGKIKVVAGGTPKELGPFLDDGCIGVAALWDPSEAAYAMVYISQLLLDGKADQIKVGMEIPGLVGKVVTIHGNNILFNNPKLVTKDNYKQYDY